MGDGTMGINVIAGLHVSIEQANGCVIADGLIPLDVLFDKLVEGKATHVLTMKLADGRPCVSVYECVYDVVFVFLFQRTWK